jgi:hypothetical protein
LNCPTTWETAGDESPAKIFALAKGHDEIGFNVGDETRS